MRKNGIMFGELRELLLDLGFRDTSSQPESIRFAHPTAGTVLLFRPQGPEEIVNDRDLLVVRRQLVDNGLIEPAALERFSKGQPRDRTCEPPRGRLKANWIGIAPGRT